MSCNVLHQLLFIIFHLIVLIKYIIYFCSFQYCHYVAGLVGIGLSRLFSASGLEDTIVGKDIQLSNSMGLFLQKTNIIRDFLEDVMQGREFWPKEVDVEMK